jgi:prepilin-type N-terminal cleavage/methylation domain-containing protein
MTPREIEDFLIVSGIAEYLMPADSSPAALNRRCGFSLMELMICIVIMGIIMIASVRILDRVDDAKVASAAQTASRINEIASIVYETTGAWPASTKEGRLPPEMDPYLANNIIGNSTPLGGTWYWNGPSGSISDSAGITIYFQSDSELNKSLLSQLDRLIDNGDLSSGACWISTNSGVSSYVMAADAALKVTSNPVPSGSPISRVIEEPTSIEETTLSPVFAKPVRPEVVDAL